MAMRDKLLNPPILRRGGPVQLAVGAASTLIANAPRFHAEWNQNRLRENAEEERRRYVHRGYGNDFDPSVQEPELGDPVLSPLDAFGTGLPTAVGRSLAKFGTPIAKEIFLSGKAGMRGMVNIADAPRLGAAPRPWGEGPMVTGDPYGVRGTGALIGADDPLIVSTARPSIAGQMIAGDPNQVFLAQNTERMRMHEPSFRANMLQVKQEPYMHGVRTNDPDKIAEIATQRMADNLVGIAENYGKTDPRGRAMSPMWYETAHNIGEKHAKKYGIAPEASYATMAHFSPQTSWDINVARHERLMQMAGENAWELSPREQRTAFEMFNLDRSNGTLAGFMDSLTPTELRNSINSSWDDLSSRERLARLNFATKQRHSPEVLQIQPDGSFTNQSGGKFNWGPTSGLDKIFTILREPNMSAVSESMGGGGKVPSFYDSIAVPKSSLPIAVVDTHNAGAATLFPAGGSDSAVFRAMGISAPKGGPRLAALDNATFGSQGHYGLYNDAHVKAGGLLGLRPNQAQSVTWAGVRDLWGPYKDDALRGTFERIWRTSKSPEEARENIFRTMKEIRKADPNRMD